MSRGPLDGLNIALHGATITDFQLLPDAREVSIAICPMALPKSGIPTGPLILKLAAVTAAVVTLRDKDGSAPVDRMEPVGIDELGRLIATHGHPLAGFDFIDSQRDSYPSGQLLFQWFLPEEPAAHLLSFYFGVTSSNGVPALLFFWVFFHDATLHRKDRSSIAIDEFAPAAVGWHALWRHEGTNLALCGLSLIPCRPR